MKWEAFEKAQNLFRELGEEVIREINLLIGMEKAPILYIS